MVQAALVSEVFFEAVGIDDGSRRFYSEQAPGATAEVGEVAILSRHSSYGRSGVMAADSDDGEKPAARPVSPSDDSNGGKGFIREFAPAILTDEELEAFRRSEAAVI